MIVNDTVNINHFYYKIHCCPLSYNIYHYTTLFRSYRELWAELTAAEHISVGERWRVTARIERLNRLGLDRKSTRLNSSHVAISYAVFCLKKKNNIWKRLYI